MNKKPLVLLVDDEPTNLKILREILEPEYSLSFAKNGEDAIQLASTLLPSIILLDIMMPGMTGYEVCEKLKSQSSTINIPIIFVSALTEEMDEMKGFEVGAVDYIFKPVRPGIVRSRVKNHLSLVRAEELKITHMQIIERLGRAAEYKDNETGLHVMRMSRVSKLLALKLGLDDAFAELLLLAAPMHDIGKIGIPDAILLKPDKLTPDEFREIQKHPQIGAEILGESTSELIRLAKSVALYHHEKWDGSGYPHALKGTEIPIEARIVAVADVFDALTNKRPYKEAWSIEETLKFLVNQKEKHFDPQIVDVLVNSIDEINASIAIWKE
ncbi:MAG TPA: HD domain-containing phosphohydrolase [Methylophilaceae bacterium]|jgi:putative two-component system response regulator